MINQSIRLGAIIGHISPHHQPGDEKEPVTCHGPALTPSPTSTPASPGSQSGGITTTEVPQQRQEIQPSIVGDNHSAPEIQHPKEFLEEHKDGVAILTLNNPGTRNAFSSYMYKAMSEAFDRLQDDDSVGVIVLTGTGDFSAGGDIKAMTERSMGFESRIVDVRNKVSKCARILQEMHKPTIAMVRGWAVGFGMTIAISCDMRIASENSFFTTGFAKLGISGLGAYTLAQLVGNSKAKELFFTADVLNGRQALELGIVNKLVADEDLEKETFKLAARLAAGPRIAYRYMKQAVNHATNSGLVENYDLEAYGHTRSEQTEEHKEFTKAFVEKRKRVFRRK